ncbi:MAG: cell division protein FtsH, partial [Rhodospirillaceae bacterium]|nr:cell division protein FtsH [Rhodospirillaceae bacterium]
MNRFGKNIALWIVIGVLLVALFNLFQNNTSRGNYSSLAFSDFLAEVEQGRINEVTIQGNTIKGYFNDGRAFTTYTPNDPGIVDRLREGNVRISAAPKEEGMS